MNFKFTTFGWHNALLSDGQKIIFINFACDRCFFHEITTESRTYLSEIGALNQSRPSRLGKFWSVCLLIFVGPVGRLADRLLEVG